jgi:hypothetical protein
LALLNQQSGPSVITTAITLPQPSHHATGTVMG